MKEEKKLWFLIFPFKHKLLSKEIFKSQKLLGSEPELGWRTGPRHVWLFQGSGDGLLPWVTDRTYSQPSPCHAPREHSHTHRGGATNGKNQRPNEELPKLRCFSWGPTVLLIS